MGRIHDFNEYRKNQDNHPGATVGRNDKRTVWNEHDTETMVVWLDENADKYLPMEKWPPELQLVLVSDDSHEWSALYVNGKLLGEGPSAILKEVIKEKGSYLKQEIPIDAMNLIESGWNEDTLMVGLKNLSFFTEMEEEDEEEFG